MDKCFTAEEIDQMVVALQAAAAAIADVEAKLAKLTNGMPIPAKLPCTLGA